MSERYSVGMRDVVNGVKTAVFTSILTVLMTVTQSAGFDVFSTDWGQVLGNVLNVAVITIVGYLGRKFFEDEEGKL